MPTSSRSSTQRCAPCRLVESRWVFRASDKLEADGEAGVERRHRLLEDHRDVAPDDGAPLARAERRGRSTSPKRSSSAVTVAVQGKSPMTASIATDLPEPDSPTIATTSSREIGEIETLDRREGARPRREADGEVADGEETADSRRRLEFARFGGRRTTVDAPHSASLQLGIERVAKPIAEEIDRDHGDEDREARQASRSKARSG